MKTFVHIHETQLRGEKPAYNLIKDSMDAYFLKEKSLGRPEVRILFVLKWAMAEWFNAILRNLFWWDGGVV